jgi:hypothetical protein
MDAATTATVGWREWVGLPLLGVAHLKAKVDTGARTSALHAEDLELFERDHQTWARFHVLPHQRSEDDPITATARVVDQREVRSSSGATDHRPVIRTDIALVGTTVTAEVTLTSRDEMGFRMLIGREALRDRFVVDPGRSYLGGRPPRRVRHRAGRHPRADRGDGRGGSAS